MPEQLTPAEIRLIFERAGKLEFSYASWENGEYIMTMNGKPIGATIDSRSASDCKRFIDSAYKEIFAELLALAYKEAQEKEEFPRETIFTDYYGKILWRDEIVLRRLNGPGECIIHDSKAYTVRRSAIVGKTVIVNFECGKKIEVPND